MWHCGTREKVGPAGNVQRASPNIGLPGRRAPARNGALLLEALVAVGMMAVAIVLGAKLLAALAVQRRAMAEYQLAVLEAGNVLERLGAVSWEKLGEPSAAEMELSEPARRMLPGAQLEVNVARAEGSPAAKRVVVRVRWLARAAQPDRVVRLVAWRYRPPVQAAEGTAENAPENP